MAITFSTNFDAPGSQLAHVWSHTVGSGHAALALRADWQAQLRKARADLGVRHVRFHGILDDEMGTYLIELDKDLYSFFNADQIFDFLLSINMRPFVELSFMPSALSSAMVQRVDAGHCNSRRAWVDMGSPEYLDAKQVDELDEASELSAEPLAVQAHRGGFDIKLNLPPHAIAAVRLELA